MSTKTSPISTPLSDDEYETLADFLDDNSPFDTDGLLGLLHAVAVAPSLMPPSAWIHVVLPRGLGGLDIAGAQEFLGLLMRLYNEVLTGLTEKMAMMPEQGDIAGCESFAAGYVAGAESDPEWIGNDNHWTFASWAAYLGGRLDLVPVHTLKTFTEHPEETKAMLYQDMDGLVLAAHDTFLRVRRAEVTKTAKAKALRTARVGRNEPCPCGSGKKYKRCCLGRNAALTQ